ncbi:hypothetical protein HBI56_046280 [Parastagonospora nodorum]|nr:hypothetical protein HBH46_115230 [Parastagonospora nodorum]KAH4972705.1 hypothetical protein HBI78_011340 [Parastagonospora nodorum]KAH5023978.1 hypothetical protein HBI77_015730 [Parastagonospora nodorum]KAH5173168.1 hypothetical protein HBH68_198280 [Parastagonospora nodorum]KAH5184178.1 hypothetical protein HBH77_176120 [Parastagonospora nodorum]
MRGIAHASTCTRDRDHAHPYRWTSPITSPVGGLGTVCAAEKGISTSEVLRGGVLGWRVLCEVGAAARQGPLLPSTARRETHGQFRDSQISNFARLHPLPPTHPHIHEIPQLLLSH